MANEINLKFTLSVDKGGRKLNRSESFTGDMTGDSFTHGVVSVGTSGEILVESIEVGTVGWVFVKNLDASNFVTVGSHATDNHLVKLLPGESSLLKAGLGTVFANSDTSACMVEYILVEL